MGNLVCCCSPIAIKESFTNLENSSTNKAPELLGLTLTDTIVIAQNRKYDPSMPIRPPDHVGLTLTDNILISQNRENDPSMAILPPEIIIGLLTYIPLKSLTQLQLVCKEWRAIIHEHYFIEKHMDSFPMVHYWYNVDNNNNNSSDSVRASYLHATKNYRIVSVYEDKESGRECCEVFTPGHSETWRYLMFPENVNLTWNKKDKRVIVISSGVAHCLLSTVNVGDDWTKVSALDWDGKVGFADIIGENVEVMELEDYRK
ncbi:hypothetical protein BUALT_Bualt03G0071400 [Buddleja alternifolia]|uniref:F-box domain-containing protein n=1 Tax=Buddleja alternifolia TaxID=168488 RepID=A0AAV6XRR9_9LAMI|nr:hypothetical protein BUALT_Bualt03G0071400 [Buddleja alternifolia]